jgi:hypothetical protein
MKDKKWLSSDPVLVKPFRFMFTRLKEKESTIVALWCFYWKTFLIVIRTIRSLKRILIIRDRMKSNCHTRVTTYLVSTFDLHLSRETIRKTFYRMGRMSLNVSDLPSKKPMKRTSCTSFKEDILVCGR